VSCRVMALVILMLPACTVVTTSDTKWEWPQDIKNME